MSIRITTLGAVQIVRGDSVLSALPAQRLRCALLIYLAVNRQATRDRVLALFWPERGEERARHALSQTIYELRRTLGEDWVEVRGEQLIVGPHVSIDLPAFEEAVERGDFTIALSLYRGAFLDGFYLSEPAWEAWVDGIRMRCQRHHRRARREAVTRLVDQGRLREALSIARDWVGLDPLDDEAQHRLIELLATMGDRAGAVRQFETYQKLLVAEDLTPLDETRELVERIRAGDVGALPAPSAIEPAGVRRPAQPGPAPATEATREASDDGAAATIRAASAVPVTPTVPDRQTEPVPASARPSWRRIVPLAAAALVLAIVLGTKLLRDPPSQPATAAAAPHRVAVLYLEDDSPPPGASHLAASLTEALIDQFSNMNGMLTVRSRHAVAPFRGGRTPPDSIGRLLDVDVLIAGSVIAADGIVRVLVQLVDPASGSVLVSHSVQRPEGQYLALVDELVEAVSGLLRQQLGRAIDMRHSRSGTNSDAAWFAFSRGAGVLEQAMQAANRGDAEETLLGLTHADSLLVEAERLDRNWAEPTIKRGWVAEKRANLDVRRPAQSKAWLDSAVMHAERVLAREPRSAIALELRGTARLRYISFGDPDPAEVATLRRQAVADLHGATEADPTRAQAFALLATLLMEQAEFAAANVAARQAERLDAFYRAGSENNYNIALSDFEQGRDTAAILRCQEGVRRFRDGRSAFCMLSVLAWSDVLPVVPDSLWRIVHSAGTHVDAPTRAMYEMLVAASLFRAGLADSARNVLDRAAPRATTPASPWIEAAVRVRLGQEDLAITRMREYLQQHGLEDARRVTGSRALRPIFTNPNLLQALEGGR